MKRNNFAVDVPLKSEMFFRSLDHLEELAFFKILGLVMPGDSEELSAEAMGIKFK